MPYVLGRIINRLNALVENRSRDLSSTEERSQFQVEFQLLGQSVTSSMSRCDSVVACDEHQARLLAQLEELEGRFIDQGEFTEALSDKRIEILQAFETRRQALLEDQQRRSNSLVRSAERLLKTIEHRATTMKSGEDLETYLATDPLVQKLLRLKSDLLELGDTVQADDIDAQLKAIHSNSRRQIRDANDLFDGDTVTLGKHAFSHNSQELSLTMLPHNEGQMAWHLTGTDYFSEIEHAQFNQTQPFWNRDTVAESDEVYRAEYLAWLVFQEYEMGEKFDELRKSVAISDEAQDLMRAAAEARLDHHYQRGLHDHDAARILPSVVELTDSAGLLRYPAQARYFTINWWQHLLERAPDEAQSIRRRCLSLARLEKTFTSAAGRQIMLAELQQTLTDHAPALARSFEEDLITIASSYAFDELTRHENIQWVLDGAAADLQQQIHNDLNQRGLLTNLVNDLNALQLDEAESLASAWLQARSQDIPADTILEAAQFWKMTARKCTINRRVEHAHTSCVITDLLGNHPRISKRKLSLSIDDFFYRLDRFHRQDVLGYQNYRNLRQELLADEQK
jgi:hypothetical protein